MTPNNPFGPSSLRAFDFGCIFERNITLEMVTKSQNLNDSHVKRRQYGSNARGLDDTSKRYREQSQRELNVLNGKEGIIYLQCMSWLRDNFQIF